MSVQYTKLSVSPEVVQATGTSEIAVMSQNAVTIELNDLDTRVATLEASGGSGGSGGGGGSASSVGKQVIDFNYPLFSSTALNQNGNETGENPNTLYPYTYSGSFQNNTTHNQLIDILADVTSNNKSLSVKLTYTQSGSDTVSTFPAIVATKGAYTYIDGLLRGTFKLSLTVTGSNVSFVFYGPKAGSSGYPIAVTLNSFIVRD